MAVNKELQRYGINIPNTITPRQIGGLPPAVPSLPTQDFDEVRPKVYKKQKWFRGYDEMIQWKTRRGISDAVMVQMKRPYRGYRFQLHYNLTSGTTKFGGEIIQ